MDLRSKILLTGCHGLLGQYIISSKPDDYFLCGIDIDDFSLVHGTNYDYRKTDITDSGSVRSLIEEIRPGVIINTAAFTKVDECEDSKEHCWRINVEGLDSIIKYAKRINSKLIHISSDYIFDGKKEIYGPDDLGSPLNYYGKAKLAAENLVKSSSIDWSILRTSTLYDVDRLKGRENFVTWVIRNLKEGNRIRIVDDQWGNPTLARNLAEAVWRVIDGNFSGIYNTAGSEWCSRLKFTKCIADLFSLDTGLIHPVTTDVLEQTALRPLKIGLDISGTENDLKIKMYNIVEGLTIFKMDYLSLHRVN